MFFSSASCRIFFYSNPSSLLRSSNIIFSIVCSLVYNSKALPNALLRNLPVVSFLFGRESGIPARSHMLFYPSIASSTVRLPSSPHPPPVSLAQFKRLSRQPSAFSAPRPRLCLLGCLSAFPSFCSHALFAFVSQMEKGGVHFYFPSSLSHTAVSKKVLLRDLLKMHCSIFLLIQGRLTESLL